MSEHYEAVIGLEVHCQLTTVSKAFSPDAAAYASEPNTHVDPLTLGHPGTLPVLNDRCIEMGVRMGLAVGSSIQATSLFARKHYFYPDLPKGYQITQYDKPLCIGGVVEIPDAESNRIDRRIALSRIHLEEDAGRSLHVASDNWTLLDFNRAGVALLEIVSEPQLRSPREAADFVRAIRQLVRYLDISDGNMEEGSLRCDANVSIRRLGTTLLGEKTEIKNLNSFRHLEMAVAFEIDRQKQIVLGGEKIESETLLWDSFAGKTRRMRKKEQAHDYRYFPEPDLPPVRLSPLRIDRIRQSLPELPLERRRRYMSEWGLPAYNADVLIAERNVANYFDDCVAAMTETDESLDDGLAAKTASNFVMTIVLPHIKGSTGGTNRFAVLPGRLAALLNMRVQGKLSSTATHRIFDRMLVAEDRSPEELAEEENLLQVSDGAVILSLVEKTIREHPDEVASYLRGKPGLIGFFMGQVMKEGSGALDPVQTRILLEEILDSMRS